MTTNTTKQWSKICLASVTSKFENENEEQQPSDVSSLTALAVAAIEQLTTLCGSEEDLHEDRRELKRLSKALRKMEPQLEEALKKEKANNDDDDDDSDSDAVTTKKDNNSKKVARTEAEKEQERIDLGQYSKSGAFDENQKKKSKFARLMGGGKAKDHTPITSDEHSTLALSREKQKQMEAELEKEFEMGRHHKGRKGLGVM